MTSLQTSTPCSLAALPICTYPARPMNGGRLDLAIKHWNYDRQLHAYEPKLNGWRALVHFSPAPNPNLALLFNRHGQPLSIASEFSIALQLLRAAFPPDSLPHLWFDCEALDRRHSHGRGTLILLDVLDRATPEAAARSYLSRRKLAQHIPTLSLDAPIPANSLLHVPFYTGPAAFALRYYHRLRELNRALHAPVYEGIVSKRLDSPYPYQLRSDSEETPHWIKHRWPF